MKTIQVSREAFEELKRVMGRDEVGIARIYFTGEIVEPIDGLAGDDPPTLIDYVNWKGEREPRNIIPRRIFFGSNEWHKESQYLLEAWDMDKEAMRTFALSGIIKWN